MISKSEILCSRRRQMLTGLSIGFGLWWGTYTLLSFYPGIKNQTWLFILLMLAGLGGWTWWMVNQVRMVRISRELVNDPASARALNDELYRHIRMQSFTTGFIALLITQALLYLVNMVHELTVPNVININFLMGVLTPVIAFLVLDKE